MTTETDEPADTLRLLRILGERAGGPCHDCPRRLCGHEVLFSVALGCQDAPRCLACLAATLGQPAAGLRDHLAEQFQTRDCFRTAWARACDDEGTQSPARPECLGHAAGPGPAREGLAEGPAPAAEAPAPARFWDAGELSCGELVLELRRLLNQMAPGAAIEVVARDRGAVEDLPAWCRLTGHRLRFANHPRYLIQRKDA